jgi:C-terminal processing protease CtpA/Prc
MADYNALVGVGIVFKHSEGGHGLKVVGLVDGGPAHESGQVSTGMLLIEIDGQDITSMLPSEIAPLILGAPHSMWV